MKKYAIGFAAVSAIATRFRTFGIFGWNACCGRRQCLCRCSLGYGRLVGHNNSRLYCFDDGSIKCSASFRMDKLAFCIAALGSIVTRFRFRSRGRRRSSFLVTRSHHHHRSSSSSGSSFFQSWQSMSRSRLWRWRCGNGGWRGRADFLGVRKIRFVRRD